jgi:hypothetical protein
MVKYDNPQNLLRFKDALSMCNALSSSAWHTRFIILFYSCDLVYNVILE